MINVFLFSEKHVKINKTYIDKEEKQIIKQKRKSLIEDQHFPFECSDSYGVESDFQVLHWHQEIEICFIKNGTGKYRINGTTYHFSRGDIFIISNDDIHLCYDDHNLIMQVIMFDPDLIQSDLYSDFDSTNCWTFLKQSVQIRPSCPFHRQLCVLLAQLEIEYEKKQCGYALMIRAALLQFIVLCLRYENKQSHENTTQNYGNVSRHAANIVRSILCDIKEHYTYEITLQTISEKYHISIPYLCSCFKKLTGNSLHQFLIETRIKEAKRLLLSSNQSILEISYACGFQSLSNFNHLFQSTVGCSPSVYRKKRTK